MSKAGVQVIDRTFDIIELLSEYPEGLGVTEIADKLELNKSTVHRIVTALVKRGYLKKDESFPTYKLGLKFIETGSIALSDIELKTEAKAYLYELSKRFNQPCHLGILDRDRVVYIDKVDVNINLRLYSQIGKRISIHSSSLGKVLFAGLEKEEQKKILENYTFKKYNGNTIDNEKDFMKEIELVKKNGYGTDDEEHDMGIKCISAPIYDYKGKTIAAISITGSAATLIDNMEKEVIETVILYGKKISHRIGYRD